MNFLNVYMSAEFPNPRQLIPFRVLESPITRQRFQSALLSKWLWKEDVPSSYASDLAKILVNINQTFNRVRLGGAYLYNQFSFPVEDAICWKLRRISSSIYGEISVYGPEFKGIVYGSYSDRKDLFLPVASGGVSGRSF